MNPPQKQRKLAKTHQPTEETLIIIDLQRGFNPPRSLVEKIRRKSRQYKRVFQTRFIPTKGSLFKTKLNYHGPENTQLCLPNVGEIHTKTGYGLPKSLLEKIKGSGSANLCGMEIDACILAAAFQLWDLGVAPNTDPSLCGGKKNRQAAEKIMARQFGEPLTKTRGGTTKRKEGIPLTGNQKPRRKTP
jgi:hypothetical protein